MQMSQNTESMAIETRGSAYGGGSPRSARPRAGGCRASLALERGSNHAAAPLQPQRTGSSGISSSKAHPQIDWQARRLGAWSVPALS